MTDAEDHHQMTSATSAMKQDIGKITNSTSSLFHWEREDIVPCMVYAELKERKEVYWNWIRQTDRLCNTVKTFSFFWSLDRL